MTVNDENTELRIRLSRKAAADMRDISEEYGYSMPDLMRFGLAFVRFALKEREKNHTIELLDEHGNRLKEIVMPEPSTMYSAGQQFLDEHHSPSLTQAIADLDPDKSEPGNSRER